MYKETASTDIIAHEFSDFYFGNEHPPTLLPGNAIFPVSVAVSTLIDSGVLNE